MGEAKLMFQNGFERITSTNSFTQAISFQCPNDVGSQLAKRIAYMGLVIINISFYVDNYFGLMVLSYTAITIPCWWPHKLLISSAPYWPRSECLIFLNHPSTFKHLRSWLRSASLPRTMAACGCAVAGQPGLPLACCNQKWQGSLNISTPWYKNKWRSQENTQQ